MEAYKQEFIKFMVESDVLKFGSFTLKSGRQSPFFMNAGAYKKPVHNVIIMGGSRIAIYLTKLLTAAGIGGVIAERDGTGVELHARAVLVADGGFSRFADALATAIDRASRSSLPQISVTA